MAYTSITVEGGLFPSDLLDRIATGDVEGQKSADFGIDGSRRLTDEIQAAFSDARVRWESFQRRLERSRESPTTITREDWMIPFLELLGFYDIQVQRASAEAGGESYFISHRWGDDPNAPPVHIVAIDQDLDRRDSARRSPHAVVQDFLNRADALWGVATNGRRLRLLRDSARLSKPTYLEFDLEGMAEGNLYSEFVVLYRLLHATRFPRDGASAHDCLLERYYQQGIDEGGRVRDKLRDGVEEALKVLGTAFLQHSQSTALRQRFADGAAPLDAQKYYRQLLRLVYRFLFLMVAEERRLVFPQDADTDLHAIYTRYYSVARLRERADRYFAGDDNADLWLGLRETFRILRDDAAALKLGLSALNGELFGPDACRDLENASCANDALLTAVRHLSTFVDTEGTGRRRRSTGIRRRVNYAALDVEEFGSVYESLLDFHPQVTLDPPHFDLVTGSERKQTGSYYTPPELVRELIESALVPVMEEKLDAAKGQEAKEQALLDLRVCDPAAGSGHFLLAAARRIARELAKVRGGEDEPTPAEYRHALRDVIRQCIYAVDKNPLAVDLCKVALWMEGHNAGLPLSFLDHHVKCGDSLVGVFNLKVLEEGIPDEAYKPVTGDDKTAARYYRERNKKERGGQRGFDSLTDHPDIPDEIAAELRALAAQDERNPDDVHAKEALYTKMRARGTDWERLKIACDLWTYAFFAPMPKMDGLPSPLVPTTGLVRDHLGSGSARADAIGAAVAASHTHPFFHWPLEFPDIFARGGFDVLLGNPPWEKLQSEEIQWFGSRAPQIAAMSGSRRKRAIASLDDLEPVLAEAWRQQQRSDASASHFIKASGRYPLTGVGKFNSYALFAETFFQAASGAGRAGMIVPSGIATDDTTKLFFQEIITTESLVSLYDFENTLPLFPGVHRSFKFCLLTLRTKRSHDAADFVFFAREVLDLRDLSRHSSLTADDIQRLNPNTKTCPIFRYRRDAELTKAIYDRVPPIEIEGADNPWSPDIRRILNETDDSGDFLEKDDLASQAWHETETGDFRRGDEVVLRLYEAKMMWHFDHRFATYRSGGGSESESVTLEEHADCQFVALPKYWYSAELLRGFFSTGRVPNWLLVFRRITNITNERTIVFSILPKCATGTLTPVVMLEGSAQLAACFLGEKNSFVFDYVSRQKISGTDVNLFKLKQLPSLEPWRYETQCYWDNEAFMSWIGSRTVELTYTSWDLTSFAREAGWAGPPFVWDENRRSLLRCELDAAFFHLYGIERDDVDYIMDTFPIVKRRDEQRHGEYRTKRVILEIYDEMAEAIKFGKAYQTRLDPPPADPRVAHPPRGQAKKREAAS